MERTHVGIIGCGSRGRYIAREIIAAREELEITALVDIRLERAERLADELVARDYPRPALYRDYRAMLDEARPGVTLVLSSWQSHVDACIWAMRSGSAVGCEVGGAYTVEDCWALVRCYEETGSPIMLMENCNYGRYELLLQEMVQRGCFGELVHCEGAYCHDLREEVATGELRGHYRLENYEHRNCENYPTHELGPILKYLKLNRGNRMLSLSAIASKARGVDVWYDAHAADFPGMRRPQIVQGDVVTTMISCAGGETITLKLDTTLPRYYSRGLVVQGTKGIYTEDNQSIYLDDEGVGDMESWQAQWGNAERYLARYEHPLWQEKAPEGAALGHDGMDYLVYTDFCDRLLNGDPMPLDVYDMAALLVISPLSERSIREGGSPQEVPDFTGGRWINRPAFPI